MGQLPQRVMDPSHPTTIWGVAGVYAGKTPPQPVDDVLGGVTLKIRREHKPDFRFSTQK